MASSDSLLSLYKRSESPARYGSLALRATTRSHGVGPGPLPIRTVLDNPQTVAKKFLGQPSTLHRGSFARFPGSTAGRLKGICENNAGGRASYAIVRMMCD